MTTEEILAYMTELIERAVAEAHSQKRYRIVPVGGYDPDWSASANNSERSISGQKSTAPPLAPLRAKGYN